MKASLETKPALLALLYLLMGSVMVAAYHPSCDDQFPETMEFLGCCASCWRVTEAAVLWTLWATYDTGIGGYAVRHIISEVQPNQGESA